VAVATSQRRNSAPSPATSGIDSVASGECGRTHALEHPGVGLIARKRDHNGDAVVSEVCACRFTSDWDDALALLAVLSATSCSTQRPNERRRSGSSSVSLSRPFSEPAAISAPRATPGFVATLPERHADSMARARRRKLREIDTHQRRRHHAEQ
jgi:hypothetical protein